jgi:hypothetical protein
LKIRCKNDETYIFGDSFDVGAMDRVSEELSGGGEEAREEEDGQRQFVVKGEVEAVDADFVQVQVVLARFENNKHFCLFKFNIDFECILFLK